MRLLRLTFLFLVLLIFVANVFAKIEGPEGLYLSQEERGKLEKEIKEFEEQTSLKLRIILVDYEKEFRRKYMEKSYEEVLKDMKKTPYDINVVFFHDFRRVKVDLKFMEITPNLGSSLFAIYFSDPDFIITKSEKSVKQIIAESIRPLYAKIVNNAIRKVTEEEMGDEIDEYFLFSEFIMRLPSCQTITR